MGKRDEIIVGLDIGTTKVCCVVGQITDHGIDIIGLGNQRAKGLRKGVVINIDSTVQSIRRAVEEAETMAACEIHSVYASIAGANIQGTDSDGKVAIKSREVDAEDVARVLEQARAIPMGNDREIIHMLPREFIIDDQDGISEPIGMSGVGLKAQVYVVTAPQAYIQNIMKSAERCNLDIEEVVLGQMASAEAVLEDDEKELGVAVVDIGGGTTDIVVYYKGAVIHTGVIPVGGNNVTNDIAVGLRTPMAEAEKIKLNHGCALSALVSPEDTIEVPSVGGRSPRILSRSVLSEIVEPRVEELFGLVKNALVRAGVFDKINSGIVITGGACMMEGMTDAAEEVTGLPVRLGIPKPVGGLYDLLDGPRFATAVGLVLYGSRKMRGQLKKNNEAVVTTAGGKFRQWLREVF